MKGISAVDLRVLGTILLILGPFSHRWFRPLPGPRGVHFGPEAASWAASRFPFELPPVAAFLADLLCDQLGVELKEIEAHSHLIDDLQMEWAEAMEVAMRLEDELGIEIPEDAELPGTFGELAVYLHERLGGRTGRLVSWVE